MRRELPLAITFCAGIIYAMAYYFTIPVAVTVKSTLDNWFLIVSAVGCMLGVINLTRIHTKNISLKRGRYWRSILLFRLCNLRCRAFRRPSRAGAWLYL